MVDSFSEEGGGHESAGNTHRQHSRQGRQRFRPHVTLAYLRRPDPAQVAAWIQANNLLKSPPIRIESFGLYSSVLTKEGSFYEQEAEYPLRLSAHPG